MLIKRLCSSTEVFYFTHRTGGGISDPEVKRLIEFHILPYYLRLPGNTHVYLYREFFIFVNDIKYGSLFPSELITTGDLHPDQEFVITDNIFG